MMKCNVNTTIRKLCFGITVIIAICSLTIGCSDDGRDTYRVRECNPGLVALESCDAVEVSPQIYDLISQNAVPDTVAVHPYNTYTFFSAEHDSFTYSGLTLEDWYAFCHEEGISYEEYVFRCEQYTEAAAAETSYLFELFFNQTGIKPGDRLENGFYEAEVDTERFLAALYSKADRPAFFVCTAEEYQNYFAVPISVPN